MSIKRFLTNNNGHLHFDFSPLFPFFSQFFEIFLYFTRRISCNALLLPSLPFSYFPSLPFVFSCLLTAFFFSFIFWQSPLTFNPSCLIPHLSSLPYLLSNRLPIDDNHLSHCPFSIFSHQFVNWQIRYSTPINWSNSSFVSYLSLC